MTKFLILILIGLAACAKGGDSNSSAAATKSLYSRWVRTDGGLTVDLTGMAVNTPKATNWLFQSGAICNCMATLNGNDTSGSWTIAGCTYVSGGGSDPGCSSLNQTGSYAKSGASLQLCDSTSCGTYQ